MNSQFDGNSPSSPSTPQTKNTAPRILALGEFLSYLKSADLILFKFCLKSFLFRGNPIEDPRLPIPLAARQVVRDGLKEQVLEERHRLLAEYLGHLGLRDQGRRGDSGWHVGPAGEPLNFGKDGEAFLANLTVSGFRRLLAETGWHLVPDFVHLVDNTGKDRIDLVQQYFRKLHGADTEALPPAEQNIQVLLRDRRTLELDEEILDRQDRLDSGETFGLWRTHIWVNPVRGLNKGERDRIIVTVNCSPQLLKKGKRPKVHGDLRDVLEGKPAKASNQPEPRPKEPPERQEADADITCPQCGEAENNPGAQNCRRCGERLALSLTHRLDLSQVRPVEAASAAPVLCAYCDAPLTAEVGGVCSKCGRRQPHEELVADDPSRPPQSTPPASSPPASETPPTPPAPSTPPTEAAAPELKADLELLCGHCGEEVSLYATACPHCGTKFEGLSDGGQLFEVRCEECDGLVSFRDLSCPHCGAEFSNEAEFCVEPPAEPLYSA